MVITLNTFRTLNEFNNQTKKTGFSVSCSLIIDTLSLHTEVGQIGAGH